MSKKKRVFNTMDSYSRRNLIQNSIKIIRISKADKYGGRKGMIEYKKDIS